MKPDQFDDRSRSRRWFLRLGAAWSAALVACRRQPGGKSASGEPRALGAPIREYGSRSKFESAKRFVQQERQAPLEEAASQAPQHDTCCIITPTALDSDS